MNMNEREVRSLIIVRLDEIESERQSIDAAVDEGVISEVEYNYKKSALFARKSELDNMLAMLGGDTKPSGDITCLGRNGTLALYVNRAQLWIEADGRVTYVKLDPKVSDVEKMKRALGLVKEDARHGR